MSSLDLSAYKFDTIKVSSPAPMVVKVELNRPKKLNAMNQKFWAEFTLCFERIASDPQDIRAVVVTAAGKLFTSGIDVMDHADVFSPPEGQDVARRGFGIKSFILKLQKTFNVIESVRQPVIAAVHNGCIGGGVDLVSACDIRLCSQDTYFSIKEVDVGLAADLGTLQRFPKVVGNDSLVRELAYTSRKLPAEEAYKLGFVSQIYKDQKETVEAAINLASVIASKSPVAVAATKAALLHSRDNTVAAGLDYIATVNMNALQTKDVGDSASAAFSKTVPVYSKL